MRRRTLLLSMGAGLSVGGCVGNINAPRQDVVAPRSDEIQEDPRVDEPPHCIPNPYEGDPDSEFDWEWLGRYMDDEPSLEFTVQDHIPVMGLEDTPSVFEDRSEVGEDYWATFVQHPEEFDKDELPDYARLRYERALESDDVDAVQLTDLDYENNVIVGLIAGIGATGPTPMPRRVEETDRGLHIHAYYPDWPPRTFPQFLYYSAIEVQPPSHTVEWVRVSLTVSHKRRVHFNTTEGHVTAPEPAEDDSSGIQHQDFDSCT